MKLGLLGVSPSLLIALATASKLRNANQAVEMEEPKTVEQLLEEAETKAQERCKKQLEAHTKLENLKREDFPSRQAYRAELRRLQKALWKRSY